MNFYFFSLGKDDVTARATVIRATTDSPMSPPGIVSVSLSKQLQKGTSFSSRSLQDIWLERNVCREQKPDFHGRVNTEGSKAKLYPNFKEGQAGGPPVRGETAMET